MVAYFPNHMKWLALRLRILNKMYYGLKKGHQALVSTCQGVSEWGYAGKDGGALLHNIVHTAFDLFCSAGGSFSLVLKLSLCWQRLLWSK